MNAQAPYGNTDNSRVAKTVLAVFAAALLITGALWIRQSRAGDETAQSNDVRNPDSDESQTKKPVALVCSTETALACQKIQDNPKIKDLGVTISVENPGDTAQQFIESENIQPTLWLTAQPWAAITLSERQRLGKPQRISTQGEPVATSQFVLAIWEERAAALEKTCTPITWRCLGDTAGKNWTTLEGQATWGALKPGHPPADTSTAGLYSTIALTNAYFADQTYAANDFKERQFRSWFSNFAASVPSFTPLAGTPLDQMLLTGPASYDYAATTTAQAADQIAASRQRDKIKIVETDLVITLQLVSLANADRSEVESLVAEALQETGWDEPRGVEDSTLPSAGVMQALLTLWQQTS